MILPGAACAKFRPWRRTSACSASRDRSASASPRSVLRRKRPALPFRRKARPQRRKSASKPGCRRKAPSRANSRRGSCARSEEHTSELQSLMRITYAVFFLKKKKKKHIHQNTPKPTRNKQHKPQPTSQLTTTPSDTIYDTIDTNIIKI